MKSADFEEMGATLYLEDGTKFAGHLFGFSRSVRGELVFQTGMVGYVESLTDPSYAKQLLVLTYPLIGNYGVPDEAVVDSYSLPQQGFESDKIWPSALIIDRICPNNEQSHWQSVKSLDHWLKKSKVPGLYGIDVRLLTKKIREFGTLKAKLIIDGDNPDEENLDFVDINTTELVSLVSKESPKSYGTGQLKILAVDCGMKYNQIRAFMERNCSLCVVPYNFPIDDHISQYDGLFISNGPGDPALCRDLIDRISRIMKNNPNLPIFGICLGHQLLARAAGAETKKLLYGNRGHNQPCIHIETGRCFITSQNHGFAVDETSIPDGWLPLFINANDGTNEGLVHSCLPFFSVQFHPESSAGPTDTKFLFDIFLDAVSQSKLQSNIAISIRKMISNKIAFRDDYNIGVQRKILILGSGGLSIGQAGEFDYSGAQAIKALKEMGLTTILVNPNVATVQTSKGFADRTYFLPLTKEYVKEVIKKERPTGLLCTFGGQTALNCAIDLYNDETLSLYGVHVLGTKIENIKKTEDRDLFKEEILKIGEKISPSEPACTIEEAERSANKLGYPVLVRSAYTLGGLGSGFASNREELICIARQAFAHSNQVLIDKSYKGWKEIEYEVVRDVYDNCVTVCNMENIDPLGIHTGESIVVAPSQTLSDQEYNKLRETALKVIRHFKIIGECNIQYALNPSKLEYFIVEVNARLSRSSALASKATGYPLAYIAAKLALGESLPNIKNPVTGKTTACFEPSLDYCVVKVPRWDLSKFARVNTEIGSSMKSVGEAMGIGRSFEEALQKSLRMTNDQYEGVSPFVFKRSNTVELKDLICPNDKRIFAIAKALYDDKIFNDSKPVPATIDLIYELTKIDKWFLFRIKSIVDVYKHLHDKGYTIDTLPSSYLLYMKQLGFSDAQISRLTDSTEGKVREFRKSKNILPFIKQIDTVAAEWPAVTNYLYLTFNGSENDIVIDSKNKGVIVLGSGVYRIGSSVEFDACCVGCLSELKHLGCKRIMINCNPETVSTDYDICDRLYFEELSLETVLNIYEAERPSGIILAFGGQASNNIAFSLQSASLDVPMKVFGTSPQFIDEAEDRYKFSRALDELKILQPKWKNATTIDEAKQFCESADVGFPCLIRPSYVLSGAAMNVAHTSNDLENFLREATVVAKNKPVVVSKFLVDAKEIDVDVVSLNGRVLAMAISEHVENAGIHSGDATLVTPPVDLNKETESKIRKIVGQISKRFNATGPLNLQLIAKDNELYVIECNLRVSRSFPFVSKTYDYDFIALATKALMHTGVTPSQTPSEFVYDLPSKPKKIGVKVPQFSFSRLAGADVIMGVEMLSTGEVACFGKSRWEAYLKGLISTGFTLPKRAIFISFGGVYSKNEMFESVKTLANLGYVLYGSKGTADFYNQSGIRINTVEWPFEEEISDKSEYFSAPKMAAVSHTVSDLMAKKFVDLIINLPIRGSGAYRVSFVRTHGYKTRRMAIDNGIPLITDVKCAKLFITALRELNIRGIMYPQINTKFDCLSTEKLVQFPGLIDIHVHMRQPGFDHKENWRTGTRAAIMGGITMVLAMPNTNPALVDEHTFESINEIASANAYCDYGLYLGATSQNMSISPKIGQICAGLKMYLNDTFSELKMENISEWIEHMRKFPKDRPIVCHAEGQTLGCLLSAAQFAQRSVHICHVSTAQEINLIKEARMRGWPVTCEVCPHHLLLTTDMLDAGLREVRPRLTPSQTDCESLWANIEYIDCFATDHAPHLKAEKVELGLPGFPSIQYILPLMLQCVHSGRLTLEQLIDRMYHNPMKIFNLPKQSNTYIEVDMNEEWVIPDDGGESMAGWTPYSGYKVRGRVRTVVIRNEEVIVDSQIVGKNGFGKNIRLGGFENIVAEGINKNLMEQQIDENNDLLSKLRDSSPDANPRFSSISPSQTMTNLDNPFFGQNILSVSFFSNKEMVKIVIKQAEKFHRAMSTRHQTFCDLLKNYTAALVFYEPSTRTLHSFENAMYKLGGKVSILNHQYSSIQKGESLDDTIQMMSSYCDVIVLRHPEVDAVSKVAEIGRKPIINAGDGSGEHPTQALLDLYTIQQKLGTINRITISMVGDLKNGRTVHSLAKILCLYRDITINYVSPTPKLGMPDYIIDYVRQNSNFTQNVFTNLVEGIRGADVIYMTRIQKERFSDLEEYERIKDSFILTPKVLKAATSDDNHIFVSEKPHQKTPIIMHPLPRLNEISRELDKDDRAVYMQQAENGLYVRMALLSLVLGAAY